MTPTYTPISDLAKEAQPPANGTLSRTPFKDEPVEAEAPGECRASEAPGPSS
jgi:hypothetical protein